MQLVQLFWEIWYVLEEIKHRVHHQQLIKIIYWVMGHSKNLTVQCSYGFQLTKLTKYHTGKHPRLPLQECAAGIEFLMYKITQNGPQMTFTSKSLSTTDHLSSIHDWVRFIKVCQSMCLWGQIIFFIYFVVTVLRMAYTTNSKFKNKRNLDKYPCNPINK